MTWTALALVVASAVIHATWNLRSKQRSNSVPAFFVVTLLGTLCIVPVLIPFASLLPLMPRPVWLLLALTGMAQAVYYVGLAHAYRLSDISFAYPVARSLPVLAVPLVTTLLGQGEAIAPLAWMGMVLIVAGVLLLPLVRFADLHPRVYLSHDFLAVMLAAAGTTAYSVIDDHALRLLRGTPGWNAVAAPAVYIVLEALFSATWLGLFALIPRASRRQVGAVLRQERLYPAITGVMIFLAYGLILAAMAFAANVGYIVAFRQLSIPLTAIAGIVLLREKCHRPRVVGMIIVMAGLLLVKLG